MTKQIFHCKLSNSARDAAKTDELTRAHARAVATLPRARERFAADLPRGSVLHIKYPTSRDEDDLEYAWMLVKSWDAGKLTGELLHELVFSEVACEGERVLLAEPQVFDWTIYHADGSEEGGWTDAAMTQSADRAALPH